VEEEEGAAVSGGPHDVCQARIAALEAELAEAQGMLVRLGAAVDRNYAACLQAERAAWSMATP
jgi:hypothetical protein